jgi:hypothetical protein
MKESFFIEGLAPCLKALFLVLRASIFLKGKMRGLKVDGFEF